MFMKTKLLGSYVNKNQDFIYYHTSETKVNIKQLLMLTHSLSTSIISYCVYLTTKNWPECEVKVKGMGYYMPLQGTKPLLSSPNTLPHFFVKYSFIWTDIWLISPRTNKPQARRLPPDRACSSTAAETSSGLPLGKDIHCHKTAASRAHRNNEMDPILATRGTSSL